MLYEGVLKQKELSEFIVSVIVDKVGLTPRKKVVVLDIQPEPSLDSEMPGDSSVSGEEGVFEILKESLRKEGPRFLFKGWTPAFMCLGPNTVLHIAPLPHCRSLIRDGESEGFDWRKGEPFPGQFFVSPGHLSPLGAHLMTKYGDAVYPETGDPPVK